MAVWSLLLQDGSEGPTFIFCTARAFPRFLTQADRFILDFPIDYGPVLLLMPFGFHLTVDTLPSGEPQVGGFRFTLAVSGFRFRARVGFSIPSSFSGQRGITPAFGYSAPHSSARGT